MRIFDLIALLDPEIVPERSKVHLATWNGRENPLDVYLAGNFEEWQRWQTRRNFEREFVVSLIALPGANRWLFAGAYTSLGCGQPLDTGDFYYTLEPRSACSELRGRLIASFARTGRQPYLYAENISDRMLLSEVLPKPLSIAEFPGYKAVDLSKQELDLVVRNNLESWRAALSSVAGVYLISDTASGKLYVGSATGDGGIWQRWAQYSETGHGGNIELRRLMHADGMSRASTFRFSILEIADTHTSAEEVIRREAHWKTILMTRKHGLNAN